MESKRSTRIRDSSASRIPRASRSTTNISGGDGDGPLKHSTPKSPTRRDKSLGRKSSPTRRDKSPARKTTSPKRRATSPVQLARGSTRTKTATTPKKPSTPPRSVKTPKTPKRSPSRSRIVTVSDSDESDESVEIILPSRTRTPVSPFKPRVLEVRLENSSQLIKRVARKNSANHSSHQPVVSESVVSTSAGLLSRPSAAATMAIAPERALHLKHNYEPIVKLSEFSDDDDAAKSSDDKVTPSHLAQASIMSVLNSVLTVLIFPAIMLLLNVLCTEKQCKFQIPSNLAQYARWQTYFHIVPLLCTCVFVLWISILTALPVCGRRVKGLMSKNGQLTYTANGLFTMIMTVAPLLLLEFYFRVPVAAYLRRHWFHFAVSSILVAFLLATVAFANAARVPLSHHNPAAVTSSRLQNFIQGREVNPRLFAVLDLKMVLFRTMVISCVVINTTFIYSNVSINPTTAKPSAADDAATSDSLIQPLFAKLLDLANAVHFNPTLLSLSVMQLVYLLDLMVFERAMYSSYEVQYAGTGFTKCLELLGGVFTYTLIGRFVLDTNATLSVWRIVAAVAVFIVGYVVYRGSNLQKHAFRVNPYDPHFAQCVTIPTTNGRRLLASGYWGVVRHPNYLGDLIMHLAYLPFVCCAPPCIIVYLTCFGLVARTVSDNRRCRKRYGTAWDRYCHRVPYMLVPRVY